MSQQCCSNPSCRQQIAANTAKCPICGQQQPISAVLSYAQMAAIAALLALACVGVIALLIRSHISTNTQGPPRPDPNALSVDQVRADVLRYNGKRITIRAEIVDGGELNWVVAENLESYMAPLARAYGGRQVGSGEIIYIVPKVITLSLQNIVELTGTYDAEANALHITSYRLLQNEKPSPEPETKAAPADLPPMPQVVEPPVNVVPPAINDYTIRPIEPTPGHKCTLCNGSGYCQHCGGSGCRFCSNKGKCPKCSGTGKLNSFP